MRDVPTHWLPSNKSESVPTSLAFVDVESVSVPIDGRPDKERQSFFFAVACQLRLEDGRAVKEEWITVKEPGDLWAWLESRIKPQRPLWLFAHNAKCDLTWLNFWQYLQKGKFRLTDSADYEDFVLGKKQKSRDGWRGLLCLRPRPFIVVCKCRTGKLTIVDTYNYFQRPLADLGAMVGLEKLPMPQAGATWDEWVKYCDRDVRILRDGVLRLLNWWKERGLGRFAFTGPGLAWNAFRHKFKKHKMLVNKDPFIIGLERSALAGGEARCFYVGKVAGADEAPAGRLWGWPATHNAAPVGPVFELDVDSCYPWVMKKNLFPVQYLAWYESPTAERILQSRPTLLWLAEVELDSGTTVYPWKHAGRRFWACGKFATVLAGPELIPALKAGHVRNIVRAACYHGAPCFDRFVRYFWQEKLQAKKAKDLAAESFYKLVLVGLPGKFSQRDPDWQYTREIVAPVPWGPFYHMVNGVLDVRPYRAIGNYVESQGGKSEAPHAMPAIAAFVNAYARVYVAKLRHVAGEENCYYQYNDALHVNADGLARLKAGEYVRPSGLGKLVLKKVATAADYRGPADYTFDGRVYAAGLPDRREEVGPGKFRVTEFEGIDSIVSIEPDGSIIVTKRERSVGKIHCPGRIQPDGRVLPVLLPDALLDGSLEPFLDRDGDKPDTRRRAVRPRSRTGSTGLVVPVVQTPDASR